MYALVHIDERGDVFEGRIAALRLNELYKHEETLDNLTERLISFLSSSKFFQHPIIVDEKSNVILDGMHRTEALKKLNYDFIIAFLIDYLDPRVKIKRWCRAFKTPASSYDKILKRIKEKIRELNLSYDQYDVNEAEFMLKNRDAIAYFIINKKGLCIFSSSELDSILDIYRTLRKIERVLCNKMRYKLTYLPEDFIHSKSLKQENLIVMVPPRVEKEEVVYFARRGLLFPPKTTRHIIPIRPFYVNIPLELLKKGPLIPTVEELNLVLRKILIQKDELKVIGKVTLDRFYEDQYLYFFI